MTYKARMAALYDRKVKTPHEKRVIRTALDLLGELKVRTPVGNPDLWLHNKGTSDAPVYTHFLTYNNADGYVGGRARSNWHLDVAVATVKMVEPNADDQPNLTSYSIEKTIFVSNNLPYIKRLNEGWSTQAPIGYVDDALQIVKVRASRK